MIWSEPDAAKQFDKLLHATLNDGAQIISRDGLEVAAFVSFKEWSLLKSQSHKLKGDTDPQRKP
jgi:hypothetical protein